MTRELTGEILAAHSAIRYPVAVSVADGVLWIADAAADPGLHVVDLAGELLHSLAPRGDQIGEFAGRPFNLLSDPDDPRAVWAFDMSRQRLTGFTVPLPLDEDLVVVPLQGTLQVQRLLRTGEGFVGVSGSEDSRFSRFDPHGDLVETVQHQFAVPTELEGLERMRSVNEGIAVCEWPTRGFALVNFNFGRVEFYGSDARAVRTANSPFPSEPEVRQDAQSTWRHHRSRAHYYSCTATADRLFTLYSGRLEAQHDLHQSSSGRFIHVFDWDGDLIDVFELDRDVRGIGIDPEGRTLYAGTLADGHIVRFDLTGESR